MANNVAYHFMCLFAMSTLKYLFMSFVHFLIGLFVFFTVEFWELFVYFSNQFFVRHVDCNHFLPVNRCLFLLLTGSFTKQKFFILIRSNLSIFSFIDCAFGVRYTNSLPSLRSEDFHLFFSKMFLVLYFTF